ncbi:MAG: T9SS type A sorting domain-containing protein [Bacteroidales bacterium]|nr:T9SS type A sorting domain-containing protein [Bacteroidales bacterium]
MTQYPGFGLLLNPKIYAIADGSWSNPLIWSRVGSGGSSCNCIPAVYDSVIVDNRNIIMDIASTVKQLKIENNASLSLQNGNLVISKRLSLIEGLVHTQSDAMIVIEHGATIVGGNDNSYISGPLQQKWSFATDSVLFPIGKDGKYAPVAVLLASSTVTVFTAEYYRTSPVNETNLQDGLVEISSVEYWDVHRVSGANAYVTLFFPDSEFSGVNDYSSLVLAHWNASGSEWESKGKVAADAFYVTSGLMTDFSPVTLGGSSSSALPIELLLFEAKSNISDVEFKWITATELNNDFFEIQKSNNGLDFETIQTISGAGNSTELITYNSLYKENSEGVIYYRLKQTDFDGAYSYSTITSVEFNPIADRDILLFPSIVSEKTAAVMVKNIYTNNSNARVEVINFSGNVIYESEIGNNGQMYDEISIPAEIFNYKGLYICKISSLEASITKEIIVR